MKKLLLSFNPGIVILFFVSLPALTAAGLLIGLPNDGQNAFLLGLSKSRLIVAMALFFAVVIFTGLSAFIYKNTNKSINWLKEKLENNNFRNIIILISGVILFLAITLLTIPDKYLGEMWAIENRIHPLETWSLLTSLEMLLGIIAFQIISQRERSPFQGKWFIPFLTTLGITLAVWVFIGITGMGVIGANSFWSKIGVPILWPQILLALGIGVGLKLILDRTTYSQSTKIWLDILLIVMLWLTAVILWNHQSYVQGVFNTSPRPPTYEIYPINDAFIFDVDAQRLLTGQKIVEIDKPIYISFLAILHFLAGSSYAQFYLFQILIFAFIPICAYFIGKIIHSRPLGLIFATLLLIKELNAIGLTNYIQVSNSKMILSEMLTSLGVLLFTLFMLKWLKTGNLFDANLYIAGGILGITSLVRLNSIGILPFVILVIGIAVNFNWKKWIGASLFLTAFIVISLAPWIFRNIVVSGNPINFISSKTSGVIANERYTPVINSNQTTPTSFPNQSKYLVLGMGIVTNYLHNLIGITLMLPASFELYIPVDLVRLPYWKLDWNGTLAPDGFWIIIGVLGITSLGIASAWKRWRVVGMLPISVILGYNLTTAFALTSGGRYLVPIDWGVLLYFSIGLFDVVMWLFVLFGWIRTQEPEERLIPKELEKLNYKQILLTGLIFFIVGAIPNLLESFPQKTYPSSVSMTDFATANRSIAEFSSAGNENNLSILLNNPDAVIGYGKALYPRYLGENKGEGLTIEQDPLIGSIGYDRLSFLLIGGKNVNYILLPTSNNLSPVIQGADTWVIGCKRSNYIEAIFVVFRQNNVVKAYWADPVKINCQ